MSMGGRASVLRSMIEVRGSNLWLSSAGQGSDNRRCLLAPWLADVQAVLSITPERWQRLASTLPLELLTRPPAAGEWSAQTPTLVTHVAMCGEKKPVEQKANRHVRKRGGSSSRRPRSLRDEPGEIERRTSPLPLLTVGARIVREVKERWLPLRLNAFLLLTLQLLDTFRWRG